MPRSTVMPFKNMDGEPCFACEATENTRWYCAYDPQQKRRWLCNGNCLQHGSLKRVSDSIHTNRANPRHAMNVEDTGWTPWKPAPKQTPQKARKPPKKGAAHVAAPKRKTAVSPRSAGPKKARQPKKPTLIDDEAEDDDEDGADEDEDDEPHSEDRAFIDDDSSQTRSKNSLHTIHHIIVHLSYPFRTLSDVSSAVVCVLCRFVSKSKNQKARIKKQESKSKNQKQKP